MEKHTEETGKPAEVVPVKPETGRGNRSRSKERAEVPVEKEGKKTDPGGRTTPLPETLPFYRLFAPPEPPKYDKDREKRLQRAARVNALGDFLQQLGMLAGGGYAPVKPYQESPYLTRTNAEIDRMRKQYETDRRHYINRIAALGRPSVEHDDTGGTYDYERMDF